MNPMTAGDLFVTVSFDPSTVLPGYPKAGAGTPGSAPPSPGASAGRTPDPSDGAHATPAAGPSAGHQTGPEHGSTTP